MQFATQPQSCIIQVRIPRFSRVVGGNKKSSYQNPLHHAPVVSKLCTMPCRRNLCHTDPFVEMLCRAVASAAASRSPVLRTAPLTGILPHLAEGLVYTGRRMKPVPSSPSGRKRHFHKLSSAALHQFLKTPKISAGASDCQ